MDRSALRGAVAPAIPYSCPADEGGRDVGEYGADGLYLAGPQLAQPRALIRLIGEAQPGTLSTPPDVRRAQAAQAIAAERTAYRRSLPAPVLVALPRARRGIHALVAALRGAA